MRQAVEGVVDVELGVSIHAPREGCDIRVDVGRVDKVVSIHAPREGCDKIAASTIPKPPMFQFTHPVRGATSLGFELSAVQTKFQFTHPVRGATAAPS